MHVLPLAAIAAVASYAGYRKLKGLPLIPGALRPMPSGPVPLPPGQPVAPPPSPPSPVLTKIDTNPVAPSVTAPPGVGAAVFTNYDPSNPSVAQNIVALRYLGITALTPQDVNGDASNPDYQDAIRAFQSFVGYPATGSVDGDTQAALSDQVLARNAEIHNANVASNLTDDDFLRVEQADGIQISGSRYRRFGAVDPMANYVARRRYYAKRGL